MNILLAAYACEPSNGSEPEVGWQMALHIAKEMNGDNIYVITKENNRSAINNETLPDNLNFLYYELPKTWTFWKKGQRGVRTYYYLWMIGAARYIRKKDISFDIIHHVTFVNDWLPSFWMLLKNNRNKFIWGPIGSNDKIDNKFLCNFKRELTESIRVTLRSTFRYCDPFFHLTKKRADCIIGINEHVKSKLKLKNSKQFIAEPAIAMKKEFINYANKTITPTGTFTILSVGRLMYIKNFNMSIKAFSKFLDMNPGISAELKIIGKGEDKASLVSLAESLGIEDYVTFTGNIPLDDVFSEFSRADLFLFPTLENAGFVFLEAMSYSLPVAGLNYGGAKQLVLSNVESQLVNTEPAYNEITNSLAEKINLFYHDTDKRQSVGRQNKNDLINHFTWEAKAKKMKAIYQNLSNG
jgi:glycosyltransferase involved in cell wall biosynthesis